MGDSIEKADEAELYRLWDVYGSRMTWETARARGADPGVVDRALAELPDVTALDALEANARLVDLLTGRRWYVMRDAREAGASWSEIGAALGMSKQGAQDWYRRKIADRERCVGDLHDTERARSALADGDRSGS
jgi:hypothetical protein